MYCCFFIASTLDVALVVKVLQIDLIIKSYNSNNFLPTLLANNKKRKPRLPLLVYYIKTNYFNSTVYSNTFGLFITSDILNSLTNDLPSCAIKASG